MGPLNTPRFWLKKYLFYYERYMSHMQSLRLESKLRDMATEKMEEMQGHGMGWTEAQFLRRAVEALGECRRTLMYTYVFAYYLDKNGQLEIFQDNQSDLEATTEVLSQYLERDISEEDNLQEIKQAVQDKYKYVGFCLLYRVTIHVVPNLPLHQNISSVFL